MERNWEKRAEAGSRGPGGTCSEFAFQSLSREKPGEGLSRQGTELGLRRDERLALDNLERAPFNFVPLAPL